MPYGNAGVLTNMSKSKFVSSLMTSCFLTVITPFEALSQTSNLRFGDFQIGATAETAKSSIFRQCEDWDKRHRTIIGVNCKSASEIQINFTKPFFRSEVVTSVHYTYEVKKVGKKFLDKLITEFKNDPLLQKREYLLQGCINDSVLVGADLETMTLTYSDAKICTLYLEYRLDKSQTITLRSSVIQDAPDLFEVILEQE